MDRSAVSRYLAALAVVACLASPLNLIQQSVAREFIAVYTLFIVGLFFLLSALNTVDRSSGVLRPGGPLSLLLAAHSLSWLIYLVSMLIRFDTLSVDPVVSVFLVEHVVGLGVVVAVAGLNMRRNQRGAEGMWYRNLRQASDSASPVAIAIVLVLYGVCLMVRTSLGLTFSGTGVVMRDATGLQSAAVQMYNALNPGVSIFAALANCARSPKMRRLGVGLTTLQGVLAFASGRRAMLFMLIIYCWVWFASGGIKVARVSLAAAGSVLILTVVGPFFLNVRDNLLNSGSAESNLVAVARSVDQARGTYSLEGGLVDDRRDALVARAAFFEWSVRVRQEVGGAESYLYGSVFLLCLSQIVPRFLLPAKLDADQSVQAEQYIQLELGLPIEDSASTLVAYAVADGGLVGIIVYHAFFGAIMRLLLSPKRTLLAPFHIWCVGTAFHLAFSVEASIQELLGTLRNYCILWVGTYFIVRLTCGQVSHRRTITKVV